MTSITTYTVSKYVRPASFKKADLTEAITQLESLPAELRAATAHLSREQLMTKTLPGNWTVTQVIHHLADSHMNSFIRIKLALTETDPVIKPYDETAWANLADANQAPAAESIALLEGLHKRWVQLLRTLDDAALARQFFHPEHNRKISVGEQVPLYAWHGRNHLAHIQALIAAKGW